MKELNDFLKAACERVDRTLDVILPSAEMAPTRLHEAIRWSVFAGGKRFRPALVFAVGTAFEVPLARLEQTAAAIEMIHTFSLIHDDLPAMDDDDLRRGKLTCHKQFDEATAILAGDALQSLAFCAIAKDDTLEPDVRLQLLCGLTDASGTPNGMVAGQQLDLDAEGADPASVNIEQIHRLKTGALIEFSGAAGAMIGNCCPENVASIREYSAQMGLLFQITDDLLDISQTSETLGKTAGKDAVSNKATFPSRYGVEGSNKLAADVHDRAVASLSSLKTGRQLLTSICDRVLARVK